MRVILAGICVNRACGRTHRVPGFGVRVALPRSTGHGVAKELPRMGGCGDPRCCAAVAG
jgi:hypothetical protein